MAHAMNVFWVAGVSMETIAPEQKKAFREATVVFLEAVLSMIGDKLVDAYLHVHVTKDLWEAVESKFGATDAELAAAEKAEADKKAVEDAAAATKAAASAWPTGGYNSFIPLLIIFILAVLAVCVDLSTACLVRACLNQSH